MRVHVISCVYPPEPVVSASTSSHVAEALRRNGHDVNVICPLPSRPHGRWYPGYRWRLWTRERTPSDATVWRVLSIPSHRSTVTSRLLENVSFGIASAACVAFMRRPDAIYANTWPIVAQALLLIIAKMRRVPVVLSIQDLYPESLIVQKRGGVAAALAGLILAVDRWIGRSAAAFIVISPRMAEAYRVRRAVAAERIHIVPNWMSRDAVDITATGHELRSRMNIPEDAFLLVYGGNIGAAAGVETIIEAMRHVTNPRAILLVAGSGDRLVRCRSLAEESGRSRVRFLSPWMPEDTSGVLSAANLLVLPTRGQQSLASMPSKLITYMLAEKPVLAVASPDSDLASMVAACGCGWLSPPDDPGSMARAIDSVSRLSVEELSRAGRSARNFALEHLVEEACVPAVVAAIERASRGDRS